MINSRTEKWYAPEEPQTSGFLSIIKTNNEIEETMQDRRKHSLESQRQHLLQR